MGVYEEFAASAREMIREYGTTAVLTNPGAGNGTYDPETRTHTPATGTTPTVDLVVFDYDEKYIDGTLIKQGDKRAYVAAASGFRPQANATLPWDGKTMTVVAVKPLQPALVAVLWELQLRG